MAIYGSEISSEDLIAEFQEESANSIILGDEELVGASFPEFQEASDSSADDIFGMGQNGIIPSGIPSAVDKLWKYHNRVPDIDPPVSPVLKLKNRLLEDYTLSDGYNGICIDLNTTGYNLKIGSGSVLVAI